MKTDVALKLADALDQLAEAIREDADDVRADHGNDRGDGYGREVPAAERGQVRVAKADGPDENVMLQVPAGDLWRLVNRSRKMIRLAREGRIPRIEQRNPLSRVIKRLKAAGLVRKPRNLRDIDLND